MDDRPRRRGYARIERERRFVLDALPPHVDAGDFERLRDLYIAGTELRLRRIESPDGELILVKLGQKTIDPDAPADPRRRRMTTFYLRPADEAALCELPGRRSVKRRYELVERGRTFCIDVYEAPASAAGRIVCEVECESDRELDEVGMPDWARAEITSDASYSGFELAR